MKVSDISEIVKQVPQANVIIMNLNTFSFLDDPENVENPNGDMSVLLIEGLPIKFDHLAKLGFVYAMNHPEMPDVDRAMGR